MPYLSPATHVAFVKSEKTAVARSTSSAGLGTHPRLSRKFGYCDSGFRYCKISVATFLESWDRRQYLQLLILTFGRNGLGCVSTQASLPARSKPRLSQKRFLGIEGSAKFGGNQHGSGQSLGFKVSGVFQVLGLGTP